VYAAVTRDEGNAADGRFATASNYIKMKEVNRMEKNVIKAEKTVRIVLGIIFALLAIFASSWAGWLRIVLGILAVASLGTAFAGY
jgi:hypothetical protein